MLFSCLVSLTGIEVMNAASASTTGSFDDVVSVFKGPSLDSSSERILFVVAGLKAGVLVGPSPLSQKVLIYFKHYSLASAWI